MECKQSTESKPATSKTKSRWIAENDYGTVENYSRLTGKKLSLDRPHVGSFLKRSLWTIDYGFEIMLVVTQLDLIDLIEMWKSFKLEGFSHIKLSNYPFQLHVCPTLLSYTETRTWETHSNFKNSNFWSSQRHPLKR